MLNYQRGMHVDVSLDESPWIFSGAMWCTSYVPAGTAPDYVRNYPPVSSNVIENPSFIDIRLDMIR